jgi:hypothetical protein
VYNIEQLSALEEIRELARRYCRGVDRMDPEELRRVYWEDAADEHGVFSGSRDELVDYIMANHDRWRATMECVLNHVIEFDDGGSTARGEVYMITYMFRSDSRGEVVDMWFGRCLDIYEQRNGEWRIIFRRCVREADMSEPISSTMRLPLEAFITGDFDRHVVGRPIGP